MSRETAYSASPGAEAASRVPQYRCLWRKEYKSRVHINVAELEACFWKEARVAGRAVSVRVLVGLDSQVALGASVKGRSASGVLNRMLAAFLHPLLSSRIFPHYLYFPSALNPADDPTRGLEVRGPSASVPVWWDELAAGRPGAFDTWMGEFPSAEPAGFVQSDLLELGLQSRAS